MGHRRNGPAESPSTSRPAWPRWPPTEPTSTWPPTATSSPTTGPVGTRTAVEPAPDQCGQHLRRGSRLHGGRRRQRLVSITRATRCGSTGSRRRRRPRPTSILTALERGDRERRHHLLRERRPPLDALRPGGATARVRPSSTIPTDWAGACRTSTPWPAATSGSPSRPARGSMRATPPSPTPRWPRLGTFAGSVTDSVADTAAGPLVLEPRAPRARPARRGSPPTARVRVPHRRARHTTDPGRSGPPWRCSVRARPSSPRTLRPTSSNWSGCPEPRRGAATRPGDARPRAQ